jgi:hypothetical protein
VTLPVAKLDETAAVRVTIDPYAAGLSDVVSVTLVGAEPAVAEIAQRARLAASRSIGPVKLFIQYELSSLIE